MNRFAFQPQLFYINFAQQNQSSYGNNQLPPPPPPHPNNSYPLQQQTVFPAPTYAYSFYTPQANAGQQSFFNPYFNPQFNKIGQFRQNNGVA